MLDHKDNLKLALQNIKQGNKQEAITILKKILFFDDKNLLSNFYLGNIYAELNNYELSKKYLNKSIIINPKFVEAINSLGIVYSKLKNFKEAEKLFKKSIELNKNLPDSYNNIGILKRDQNFIEIAKDYFYQAIEAKENYFPAYLNLMELFERTHKDELLNDIINKTKSVFPNNLISDLFKAKLKYKKKNYKDVINILEKISFNNNEIIQEKSRLLNIAKSYDKLEIYDKAFEYFQRMNEYSKTNLPKFLDKEIYNSEVNKRKNFFKNITMSPWAKKKQDEREDPIFMIGFPRSGTTLLETILRSHNDIEIIEEKPIVNKLIIEINKITNGDLNNLSKLNQNEIIDLRNLYFDYRKTFIQSTEKKIIIDKLPLNTIFIGEILRVFPESKFVFSLRHPCDCVLSCYFQNFGPSIAMSNFLKLNDAAEFYNNVMSIWKNYTKIFSPNVCYVKYEDLVINFEDTIKNIVKFLNLDWSNNFYEFNILAKKRGIISTPSYYQVTETLNKKAINRWINYEVNLDQVKSMLDFWIKEYSY